MAATGVEQLSPVGTAVAAEWLQALLRFLSAVWKIDSLDHVAYSSDNEHLDLWILLREDSIEDMEQIFLFQRAFRESVGPAPVDIHVYALNKIDPVTLPPATTLFKSAPIAVA